MKSLEEVEKHILDRYPVIRLEGQKKERSESLKVFMKDFFLTLNLECNTLLRGKEKKIQTYRGARRSLGDFFMLCRYYYPDCSFKEVVHYFYVDCFKEISQMRSVFCNATKRRVNANIGKGILHADHPDEFGLVFNDWLNMLKS